MESTKPQKIKIAVIGIGNCASALIQGIHYYQSHTKNTIGLMHEQIGGYQAGDIEVVAAYDIDARKVGLDLSEAIFSAPNCTKIFQPNIPKSGTLVQMGKILDGVSPHMLQDANHKFFVLAEHPEPSQEQIVDSLKRSGAEIMVNYLPVGSEAATAFYAECALQAGLGFINNIPVFIASSGDWAQRFEAAGLPLIGDDIKSQLGATIIHRTLANLFKMRGVTLDRTYQLNTGGNTDFLNMLNRERLQSKKTSKTEAVQTVCETRLADDCIHVGPSDYVSWQNDNKIAFIRLEGRLFGDVPMNLEVRLSVEDSPNSAGVAIDAIRCCKLALDRKLSGVLIGPSACFYKHPPTQYPDVIAHHLTEDFIQDIHQNVEKV